MQPNMPSRTAQGAALHRAAHQLMDGSPIFTDPLALKIVGDEAANQLRSGFDEQALRETRGLRLFIVARSRFAEDCLDEAIARGVNQYILLGAGLDTFAYRNGRENLHVYEIDHPSTQAWKRTRLKDLAISSRADVHYVPVDFERETWRDVLVRTDFDFSHPAMFAWLGVTPYLTREAIFQTLRAVAALPAGSEIVFDYAEPVENMNAAQRARFERMAARVAEAGEPFRCAFDPPALASDLKALGFVLAEDWDTERLNARYFADRPDGLKLLGRGHMMRARV